MSHQHLSLDELAVELGRDRRTLEKQVQRGVIPGRRVDGQWRFHPAEIRQWLEAEIRGSADAELAEIESAQRARTSWSDSPIAAFMQPEHVETQLPARTKRAVLESLIEVAGRTWQVWEPAALLQACQEREAAMSTAFDSGVAVPHPRNPPSSALGTSIVVFGRTSSGIPFGGPRGVLTDLFFLVLCRDSQTHLAVLARLGRLMQIPDFLAQLRTLETAAAVYEFICAADRRLETT